VLLVLLVFALACAGSALAGHLGTSRAGALLSPRVASPIGSAKLIVSPNWSGYVATAPVGSTYWRPYFTEVTGTWTVPAARCAHAKGAGSSTVWVGLGGYESNYRPNVNARAPKLDQEEVGTDSNCGADGKPSYYAWFELVPYPSYRPFPTARDTVSAGDTMTGLVKILSPTLVELRVQDRTRAWTFTTKITFSSQDASTADWVVETPVNCVAYACREANLANFGTVTMRNISAVARGASGPLTDPRWSLTRVKLVPSNLLVPGYNDAGATVPNGHEGHAQSPAGATPGNVSADGRSFSVKWKPVATRGV
jgi:hypothetical protein